MARSRSILALLLLLGLAAALAPSVRVADAQAQDTQVQDPPSSFSVYRVYVDDEDDIDFLINAGVDLIEARGDDYVLIVGDEASVLKLEAEGFRVREDRPLRPIDGVSGVSLDGGVTAMESTYFGGYRTVDEHYSHLYAVAAAYPDLATVVDYGDSWRSVNGQAGGNDLLAVCITKIQAGDCALNPGAPKPRATIMAAIHARELQTSEIAWRLIDELTQGYGQDADITHILDTTEVWIIPVANPDGREFVELGGDFPFLQRKNMNTDQGICGGSLSSTYQFGVDLNRNASWQWGVAGSTNQPCWQTYRGTGPASEPEQESLEALFDDLWPDQKGSVFSAAPASATGVFISLHSYSELILFPPGAGGTGPNDNELRTFAFRMSHYNNYDVGTGPEILYPATGTTDDWTYGQLGVASFTYELSPVNGSCSGFTPAYSCVDSSLWPLNRDALIYSLKVAGSPYVTPLGPTTVDVTSPAIVSSATSFALSAEIDDDALGDTPGSVNRPSAQGITEAEYYVDVGPGQGGVAIAMSAADGNFGGTSETATAAVPATDLAPGEHSLLVRGRNAAGFWGPLTATSVEVFAGYDIVAPPAGAELCAGDTVAWDAPGLGKYRLRLGTTPDGGDVLNQATSQTALVIDEVPEGQPLFASVRHRPPGESGWTLHDQVAFAACSRAPITITSPATGTALCAGDVVAWDGPGSGKYRLRIGTTADGSDVLNQATSRTDVTVGALPEGQDLYISLRHRPAGQTAWTLRGEVDVTACADSSIKISTPIDGAPLCPGDLVAWDGPGSGKYRLRIGTTADGSDVLNQATSRTDVTVGALPEGQDLFVSLRHRPAGQTAWTLHDLVVLEPCV